jgi:RimJ/RimL family protein N-acetyltransferase
MRYEWSVAVMEAASSWQGRSVRLRAVEPDDWAIFHDWDNDLELSRYTDEVLFPSSRERVKQWMADLAVTVPKDDEFRWMIETLDGEVVGTINSHTCKPRMGTFRYGISIVREQRRKGYATEAIHLVLAYFFRELRYQKVNVEIYEFNEPSLRLHVRLDFREEGRLRRMFRTAGAYHDEIILGMTTEEFANSNAWPVP